MSTEEKWEHQINALCTKYEKMIYYYTNLHSVPKQDIEDLFNQIILNVVKGYANLKHKKKLNSWIITIVKNTIFDYFRYLKRDTLLLQNFKTYLNNKIRNEFNGSKLLQSELQLLRKQLSSKSNRILQEIDERYSIPFRMFYFEEKTWKEIGKILWIDKHAARKRSKVAKNIVIRRLISPDSVD